MDHRLVNFQSSFRRQISQIAVSGGRIVCGRRVKAGSGIFVRISVVLREVDEIHMGNPGLLSFLVLAWAASQKVC
jgi:hypothetical protein